MPLQLHRALGTTALAALVGAFGISAAAADQAFDTEHHGARVEAVAEGPVHPWGLAFLPDGRFLVTERDPGRLRLGTPDGRLSAPIAGVPEVFRYEGGTGRSQGGLFDVALHPGFERNGLVYLSLSRPTGRGAGTAIVRGRLVEGGSPRGWRTSRTSSR